MTSLMNNHAPLLLITTAGYLFFGSIILSLWLSYQWQSGRKGTASKTGCISVALGGAVISFFILFPTMVSWQFFEQGTRPIKIAVVVFWALAAAVIAYFAKSKNYGLLGKILLKLLFLIFGGLFLVLLGGIAYFLYLRLFTHQKDDAPIWVTYICIFFLSTLVLVLFGYFFKDKKGSADQKTEFDDLEEAKRNAPFVETLDLSNQQLTSLPLAILKFNKLKTLDLSNNQLTELPNDMNKMTHLLTIKLSDNPISDQQRAIIRKMFSPETDLIFRSATSL